MQRKTRLLLIFLFSLAVFLFFQNTPIFSDPDSFYHAGVARLMAQGDAVIDQFPWLPFSILSENYIDHHYLYHATLVPFSFGNALAGLKIATALFGALFLTLFSRLLFSLRVAYPELFVLLLLVNSPLMFRLNLAKASAFSLLFLFSGVFALLKKRYGMIALIAFLYVWAYDGWILFVGVLGVYWIVHSFGETVYAKQSVSFGEFVRTLGSRGELKTLFSGVAGVLGGVVLNPFFPNNLSFYVDHIVKIGLVGYKNVIGVGGEWYGYNPLLFLGNNALLMAVVVLGLVVYVVTLKRQGSESLVFLFLSLIFTAATLRSQRNVEYAIPFFVLFVATAFRGLSYDWLRQRFLLYLKKTAWLLFGYAVVFAIVFSVTKDVMLLRRELGSGFRFDFLRSESQWIRQNVRSDEVVFHSNWDEFPSLFFYNPYNRYIAGLDPAFMYAFDRGKYGLWRDITQAKTSNNLKELIGREFNSRIVLASKNHADLQRNLLANGFTKVYEGRDASIFTANPD